MPRPSKNINNNEMEPLIIPNSTSDNDDDNNNNNPAHSSFLSSVHPSPSSHLQDHHNIGNNSSNRNSNNSNNTSGLEPASPGMFLSKTGTFFPDKYRYFADMTLSGIAKNYPKASTAKGKAVKDAFDTLNREERAKKFRDNLRYALAGLAVFNFALVLLFYGLITPPFRDSFSQNGNNPNKGGNHHHHDDPHDYNNHDHNNNHTSHKDDNRSGVERNTLFVVEGICQCIITFLALCNFFVRYVSRNPKIFTSCLAFIPRNVSGHQSGFDSGELVECIIWSIFCPPGLTAISEQFRFLNAVCVLRLYVCIQAGIQTQAFGHTSTKVMSRFFGLKMTSGIFWRWALTFHKWKILIPAFTIMWLFLSLVLVYSDDVSFFEAFFFLATSMTTTGYGNFVPASISGRIVAMMAMAIGLIVLGYLVAETHLLLERSDNEAKVLDTLHLSRLHGKAKRSAARLLLFRFRMRKRRQKLNSENGVSIIGGAESEETAQQQQQQQKPDHDYDVLQEKVTGELRHLRDLTEQIHLIRSPVLNNYNYGDPTQQALEKANDRLALMHDTVMALKLQNEQLAKRQEEQSQKMEDLMKVIVSMSKQGKK